MTRREFTRATKRAAFERSGGRCEGTIGVPKQLGEWLGLKQLDFQRCNAPLDQGVEYDHEDPVWLSDDASLSNCICLCIPCHRAKTKTDVKNIAKVKRIRDKRIGALTSKRPMPGSRASGLKKKMNGEVVRR